MKPKAFSSQVDKSHFSVTTLEDDSDEKAYWRSKSPVERLAALEFLRQHVYGYDPSTTRLQNVLSITERL